MHANYLLLLFALGVMATIRTTPSGAYSIIQDQIIELNKESQNNAQMMASMKNTLKQATQELREAKLMSNIKPQQTRAATRTRGKLSRSDKDRLTHINSMMEKIKNYEAQLKQAPAETAAAAPAAAVVDSSSQDIVNESPEMKYLNDLNASLTNTRKAMDKESVQNESLLSEAQLKEELERYKNKLEKIDQFAVLKIRGKPQRQRTLLEKNLSRRQNYIRTREKQLLEELHRKEMELHATAPTFQGDMKQALKLIFKNEDKQRFSDPAVALAKKQSQKKEEKKETKKVVKKDTKTTQKA